MNLAGERSLEEVLPFISHCNQMESCADPSTTRQHETGERGLRDGNYMLLCEDSSKKRNRSYLKKEVQ